MKEGNELIQEIIRKMAAMGSPFFMSLRDEMKEVNVSFGEMGKVSKQHLEEKIKLKDTERWKEEVRNKTTLELYWNHKRHVKEESWMDNRPSSAIMYQARSGCLPVKERKRHWGEEGSCEVCGDGREDLEHFMLWCTGLQEKRNNIKEFQRPYTEETKSIVGDFLFNDENITEKKEQLYEMWKLRCKKIEERNGQN